MPVCALAAAAPALHARRWWPCRSIWQLHVPLAVRSAHRRGASGAAAAKSGNPSRKRKPVTNSWS
eukprot:285208-Alexandrium_andersonii.AAC.1